MMSGSLTVRQHNQKMKNLRVPRTVKISPPTECTALKEQLQELLSISRSLLQVAQKYIPTTPEAYTDTTAVVQCAKQLQNLGVGVQPDFRLNAAMLETNKKDMIVTSPEYRYLRNKAIAGFATIADLGAKASTVGTIDFQTGLREGYRRASNLAIAFLDDIYAERPYECPTSH